MTITKVATREEWAREIKATDAARDKLRGFRGRPTDPNSIDELELEDGTILVRPGSRQSVAAPSTRAVEPARTINAKTSTPSAKSTAVAKSAAPKELQPMPGQRMADELRRLAETEADDGPEAA